MGDGLYPSGKIAWFVADGEKRAVGIDLTTIFKLDRHGGLSQKSQSYRRTVVEKADRGTYINLY